MARETIILTRQEVAQQVSLEDIIPAIENCLAQFEKGEDLLRLNALSIYLGASLLA